MLLNTWGEVFTTSLQGLWLGTLAILPKLLLAIIFFMVGWIVGKLVCKAIAHLFSALKIDRLFSDAGIGRIMDRAGYHFTVGELLGGIVKWFIILVFLVSSLELIGLVEVNQFLVQIVSYLPHVIIAALILIAANLIADLLKKIISGSSRVAHLRSAQMMGAVASYAVWVFAFIFALSELGIAPQFMQILFIGIVAMFAISGGLAFGLGGKEAASRVIENVREDMKSHVK